MTGARDFPATSQKILIIAHDLNPSYGSEAGRASLWVKLAGSHFPLLVVTDVAHRKHILAERYPGVEFFFVEVSATVRRLARRLGGAGYAAAYRVFASKAARTVAALAAREPLALIHCLTPASLAAYNRLYRLGIPMLVGPIGGAAPTPPGFLPPFSSERLLSVGRDLAFQLIRVLPGWRRYYHRAAVTLVGSDHIRTLLPRGAQERTELMFTAVVDTEQFRPPPVRPPSDNVTVLFVGRLDVLKGIFLLVEAVRELRARGLDGFRVEVAGDGPRAAEVDRLIRRYALQDHVQLLGNLPRAALIEKYRASSIFCLPTLREAGGNAVLEAMACGLPIVTSDYDGPRQSVSDECGIRVPMRGAAAYVLDLANALERLIGDPALRERMGAAARDRALRHFSRDALERKLVAIYDRYLPEGMRAASMTAHAPDVAEDN